MRGRRLRHRASRPLVVLPQPSLFQEVRTAKEVAISVGFENIFLQRLELEPSAPASISFDVVVPLAPTARALHSTSGCSHRSSTSHSKTREKDGQRNGTNDLQLFFVICGDATNKDRLFVKQLSRETLFDCGIVHLATVYYEYPSSGDAEATVTHQLFHVAPLNPTALHKAEVAVGPIEPIVDSRCADGSESASENFTWYSFRIALSLYRDMLDFAAGRLLHTLLEVQTANVAQRREDVQTHMKEMDRLRDMVADVQNKRRHFISTYQNMADDESIYMTNGERSSIKNLLRETFDFAISQEDKLVGGIHEIISQQEKALHGLLRRKRLSPSSADLWAFRLFDPGLTGIISTPNIRTVLSANPELKTGNEITEELILMGKISSAQPFHPSTIRYDLPKS